VDVERPVPAGVEQTRRQDQPVGGDYQAVRARRSYPFHFARVLEALRLKKLDAVCRGKALDRARNGPQAASRGPIGLG
jgi:hypothetical protein